MSLTAIKSREKSAWANRETPTTAEEWIARAGEVADVLAINAVERDRVQKTPHAEVQLLKDAGLVTLLGSKQYGGAGQSWDSAYRVIRRVSAGDGSIGQLLGYHYLWSQLAEFWGTPEQARHIDQQATQNNWFFGGAVNPRDADLNARDAGDNLVFNGGKTFSTGSKVSDVTWLEGVLEGSEPSQSVFALASSDHPGITFHNDWDALGARLSESGSVTIKDVSLPWSSALGWVNKAFEPRTHNSLTLPAIQLVFTNIYLGSAEGALQTATEYTRTKTRAWPYGGDDREHAVDEPYILDIYGDLQSKLWAATALADLAAKNITALHENLYALTPQQRGEVAVLIAAAKQRAVDTGLEIGTKIYEVTGARASANKYGFDIFWRNIRTHSLHDPIAYKRREVGRYALLREIPEPTWYT